MNETIKASGNRLKLFFNGLAIAVQSLFNNAFIVYLLGLIPGFD